MKKWLWLVTLIALTTPVFAANPDGRPSLGIGYSWGKVDGPGSTLQRIGWLDIPTNVPTVEERSIKIISPSFRWPVNNKVTLDFSYDYYMEEYTVESGYTLDTGDVSGGIFGVHYRLYLGD
jgi:hypothetical protein